MLKISFKTYNFSDIIKIDNLLKKLKKKNINIKNINIIKNKNKIYTVLKSPHVHKKSREQFNYQFYKKTIIIEHKNIITLLYINLIIKKFITSDSFLIFRIFA